MALAHFVFHLSGFALASAALAPILGHAWSPFLKWRGWPWPPLVMAVGQFMLYRREAYERAAAHAAVRANVAADIALARRLVARGSRWRASRAARPAAHHDAGHHPCGPFARRHPRRPG